MRNDQLKIGDAVAYVTNCVQLGIVERTKNDIVFVRKIIQHRLRYIQHVKKDDVTKLQKVYIRVSNAKMEEIKKRCDVVLYTHFSFKRTKQIEKLYNIKDKHIIFIFYFKSEKRYFYIRRPGDIHVEENFITLFI